MSARLTALEKLARRLCWAEFGPVSPKKLGTTEVRYWRELPAGTKARYHEEACRMCWAVNAITRSAGGLDIWWEARKAAIPSALRRNEA